MGRPSKYPFELRERAVRLARGSDRPISAVARDLGVHHETLRVWVRQDEADDGRRACPRPEHRSKVKVGIGKK